MSFDFPLFHAAISLPLSTSLPFTRHPPNSLLFLFSTNSMSVPSINFLLPVGMTPFISRFHFLMFQTGYYLTLHNIWHMTYAT